MNFIDKEKEDLLVAIDEANKGHQIVDKDTKLLEIKKIEFISYLSISCLIFINVIYTLNLNDKHA